MSNQRMQKQTEPERPYQTTFLGGVLVDLIEDPPEEEMVQAYEYLQRRLYQMSKADMMHLLNGPGAPTCSHPEAVVDSLVDMAGTFSEMMEQYQ